MLLKGGVERGRAEEEKATVEPAVRTTLG
uniref:Uncharacterized protein n=1 Tax=Anguilla anguilla TaxID=7936 RepID=A0A0E9ULY4_ANGAN